MDPYSVFLVAAVLLGLLLGSFLNVCISRLPQGESIVHPRSHCRDCGAQLPWYDNIPLLSWFLLRARCRTCRHRISWRYPAIELATALWFLYTSRLFWQSLHLDASISAFGAPPPTGNQIAVELIAIFGLAVLGFLLLGLMVTDWQTYTLPDAMTLSGIAIAFVLVCVQALFLGPTDDQVILSKHHIQLTSPGSVVDTGNVFLTGPEALIFGRLVSVLLCAGILLLVRWLYHALRHREGLGLGDVKLLAMIAAFLGFWPAVLALFAGILSATVYALYLLARRNATASTRLPLGSFLAAGGLLAAAFGHSILAAYATLLR